LGRPWPSGISTPSFDVGAERVRAAYLVGKPGRYTVMESDTHNVDRRNALVRRWGLVFHVVIGLRRKQMLKSQEFDDAVSVGALSLLDAAGRWREDRGAAFYTFACVVIRTDVIRWLIRKRKKESRQRLFSEIESAARFAAGRQAGLSARDPGLAGLEDTEVVRRLPELLAQLPVRERDAIRDRFGIGAAARLGSTPATSWSAACYDCACGWASPPPGRGAIAPPASRTCRRRNSGGN
jgi:RNA polymerase sigma factor (sigma-70 family)